jgi:hypothetical protein
MPVSNEYGVVAAAHVRGLRLPLPRTPDGHVVILFALVDSPREERVASGVRSRLLLNLLVDSDLEIRGVDSHALDARTIVAETGGGAHLARGRLLLALVVAPSMCVRRETYTRRLWPGVIDGEA